MVVVRRMEGMTKLPETWHTRIGPKVANQTARPPFRLTIVTARAS